MNSVELNGLQFKDGSIFPIQSIGLEELNNMYAEDKGKQKKGHEINPQKLQEGSNKLLFIIRAQKVRRKAKGFYRFLTACLTSGKDHSQASTLSTRTPSLQERLIELKREVLELHEENSKLTIKVEESTNRKLPERTRNNIKPQPKTIPYPKEKQNQSPNKLYTESKEILQLTDDITRTLCSPAFTMNSPSSVSSETTSISPIPSIGQKNSSFKSPKNNQQFFNEAIQSIPQLINNYYPSFTRLFSYYAQCQPNSKCNNYGKRTMSPNQWVDAIRHFGLLCKISTRDAYEIYTQVIPKQCNGMDFAGFIQGLIDLSKRIYSNDKYSISINESEKLILIMASISDHLQQNHGDRFFPYIHTHIRKIQQYHQLCCKMKTETNINHTIDTSIPSNKLSIGSYIKPKGIVNMKSSILDPYHTDMMMVVTTLDSVLPTSLKKQLKELFTSYAICGESQILYLTFIKFNALLKNNNIIQGSITHGIINLVFDKALKSEILFIQHQRQQKNWSNMKSHLYKHRMTFTTFKIALADLALRESEHQHEKGLLAQDFHGFILKLILHSNEMKIKTKNKCDGINQYQKKKSSSTLPGYFR